MFDPNSLPLTSDGTQRDSDSARHNRVMTPRQNRWNGVQRMLPIQTPRSLHT